MAKERYIKINGWYFPIESSIFAIERDGMAVNIYEAGGGDELLMRVLGEDASNLIALLDEMSFDLALLREQTNG